MLVVSPVDFEKSPSKYCEMAAKDNVFIQYASNYIKLAVIKHLPRRHKNPNNPSPSGDVWFDDPQNLAYLEERIKNIGKEKGVLITGEQDLRKFFESL
ncbi:MAG: hypothetical protein FWF51_12615 [Chitinivibrionia bacterium]|nr:hypothetical protein [Chitinivibrionia bacterium]